MEDTPLGRTVLIRKEDDPERLANFTEYEKRVRREWQSFLVQRKAPNEPGAGIQKLEDMFRQMFS
jgi:hypothetical protein